MSSRDFAEMIGLTMSEVTGNVGHGYYSERVYYSSSVVGDPLKNSW